MINKNISGKNIADRIYNYIKEESKDLMKNNKPHIGIIQVGNNSASEVYIQRKMEKAALLDFSVTLKHLKQSSTKNDVIESIQNFNNDENINGILLQLPLNSHEYIDPYECLDEIVLNKDIEGLNSIHTAFLNRGLVDKGYIPCTAAACLSIINTAEWNVNGLKITVVGGGITAGRPIVNLLTAIGGIVTFCPKQTDNLVNHVKSADLIVSCIGKPNIIDANWFKDQSAFIDCGLHRLNDGNVVGDVKIDSSIKLSWFTPVPGGIGPVTVAWLMQNLFESFRRSAGLKPFPFPKQLLNIFNERTQ